MMRWLLNVFSPPKLTGPYSGGQKLFQCVFPKADVDSGKEAFSQWQTSGNVSWALIIKSRKTSEEHQLCVAIKCKLEDHIKAHAEDGWSLEADYVIRLVNHTNPQKYACVRDTRTFSEDAFPEHQLIKCGEITGDFLQNNSLTFEVEIGVGSWQGIPKIADFTVKSPQSSVVLIADNSAYYVDRKILSEKSSVFQELLSGEGVGSDKNQYLVGNVEQSAFHILIQFIYDHTIDITLDNIEHLWEIADKFKVEELKVKCKGYLMNSFVDDAEAIKIADKLQMSDVIVEKLKQLNTIPEIKEAFKYYRSFSDESVRLLLKKLIQLA